jgi:phage-related protein (TIGR01555 family)
MTDQPADMPAGPNAAGRFPPVLRYDQVNLDGWLNLLAQTGTKRDKRTQGQAQAARLLADQELEAIYMSGGAGARIAEMIPEDMTRQGWEWDFEDEALEDKMSQRAADLSVASHVLEALTLARVFGGSVILIGALDGQDLDKPLNVKSLRAIDAFRVLDRRSINLTSSVFQTDPKLPGYGSPVMFQVMLDNGLTITPTMIHASRMIIIKGRRLPSGNTVAANQDHRWWGISELQFVYEQLRDFDTSIGGVSSLMYELVIGKYKLDGLAAMLSEPGGEEKVHLRMSIMDMSKSILRGVLLDTTEDYTRDSLNLGGVSDVLDRMAMCLSMASGIPQTKLFGRSPAGMNATGESDLNIYYDLVDAGRQTKLAPILRQLGTLLAAEQKIAQPFEIEFPPLKQMTEKELADIEKTKADAFAARANAWSGLVTAMVATPEQAAEALGLLPEMEDGQVAVVDRRDAIQQLFDVQARDPKTGRFISAGGSAPVSFGISLAKMKANPMPKALKKQFAKEGGVSSPNYQKWIKTHWASDDSEIDDTLWDVAVADLLDFGGEE